VHNGKWKRENGKGKKEKGKGKKEKVGCPLSENWLKADN